MLKELSAIVLKEHTSSLSAHAIEHRKVDASPPSRFCLFASKEVLGTDAIEKPTVVATNSSRKITSHNGTFIRGN